MVMASSDKELQQQILEAGEKLLTPPASVDELLPLLDHIENCLSKVEQSPTKSMQNALVPSQKALVADQLFKHSDVDVKVAVACCISEITRITAPDAPYDDDQMKDVFQLIVSSFENLSDKSSRSYTKRTSILETVAKVRSCVVMLDLECDAMILEMFQHFLSNIRDYHPDNVYVSMETIMSLVLEESEEISAELLSPLLATVKKGNKEVLPIARKLGEKVLETCANKVKPYLQHAVKSMGLSLDDYSDVVASICQESSDSVNAAVTAGENKVEESEPVEASPNEAAQADKEIAAEAGSPKLDEPTNDKSPKSVVSNGVAQNCEDESLAESCGLKKQDDSTDADPSKNVDISTDADPNTLDAEKLVNDESKPEEASKRKGRKVNLSTKSVEPSESSNIDAEKDVQKPLDDKAASKDIPSSHEETAAEATVPSKNRKTADTSQPSSPKALEAESVTVASPDESENLPKAAEVSGKIPEGISDSEAKPNKRTKKEILAKDSEPSADAAARKTSEGISDSEAKPNRRSSKKTPGKISNEEKTSKTDTSKKETTNESETKSLKKLSKKVDVSSNNGDESSLSPVENKKQRHRGKSVSDKSTSKGSTKDDDKVSSPKSAAKSTKNVHQLETPKTNNKRKHASEKGSETQDNGGEDWVGKRVKVYWPKDKIYYTGTIDSYNASRKKQHKVVYDDGEVEDLNLKRERWEFIGDDDVPDVVEAADKVEADEPESSDAPPETPPKKKAKTSADQAAKEGKVDSVKGKRASSSKSKTASTKSARNSKDDTKAAKKTEDENIGKAKDSKTATKSAEVASKSSSKSKTGDETKTPKTSKQETPKTGKSKQDTPKNKSSKTNNNGAGKSKSGSKVKETVADHGDDNNDSTDSDQPLETVKAKSKSQKGQAKKRRRV